MDEVAVRRSDPIYNAHSYLTKVPVDAIIPFMERYSGPDDLVLDVFAGSGMTGVAAAIAGRRAILADISELGRHVGTNYLRIVDGEKLSQAAADAVAQAKQRVPDVYSVTCELCGASANLSRTVWSKIYGCTHCDASVNFYRAIGPEGNGPATCPGCSKPLEKRRADSRGEEPVLDVLACDCSRRLLEQLPDTAARSLPDGVRWPDLEIGSEREMFRRSALMKHGLTSTAAFFSERNLTALAILRDVISEEGDDDLRQKLMFAFTAILPRASKRYQWSAKRPLNAQNQTYYIAPVFFEWNVFDLFERKVAAIRRSDRAIEARLARPIEATQIQYHVASADNLSFIEDASVDYVFTDPPFGSNIFYSDMNMFQEAWLGSTTNVAREAVIPTNGDRQAASARYRDILSGALKECFRVLKKGGKLSLVFSNSSGSVWALAQESIREAGFELLEDGICLLDKGQRSVKGLASGYEKVVTTDLIITMAKPNRERSAQTYSTEPLKESVSAVVRKDGVPLTPSHLYLRVVRRYLSKHWALDTLHFGDVVEEAQALGLAINRRTGKFSTEQIEAVS